MINLAIEANSEFQKENKLVVITGGSLGSLKINKSTINALPYLKEVPKPDDLPHNWEQDWEEMGQVNSKPEIDYRAIEYEEQMPIVLNSADLIVSRAGGSITAEIIVGAPINTDTFLEPMEPSNLKQLTR